MSPCSTACVPWYRPHSSAPNVAMMMKATSTERARVRRTAVSKAFSVERVEALRLARFRGVALHHRNRVEHLGGDGARSRRRGPGWRATACARGGRTAAIGSTTSTRMPSTCVIT